MELRNDSVETMIHPSYQKALSKYPEDFHQSDP